MTVSEYRAMWAMVLFDLPVGTKSERKYATQFRKRLLEDGFWMLQFSVYARPCSSEENAAAHVRRIEQCLPPGGQVRILRITDKQFERMQIFEERRAKPTEQQPEQLVFF